MIPMAMTLEEGRRATLTAGLRGFFLEEFDEDLSDFRANQILDFFLGALGPQVYNQAVQDALRFMQSKLEDLEGDVFEPEGV